jgi:hypothetical protein
MNSIRSGEFQRKVATGVLLNAVQRKAAEFR